MKAIFFFFLLGLLLVSYATVPTQGSAQSVDAETSVSQSPGILPPSLSQVPTQKPTFSITASATAIPTKTFTLTPSVTPTPTEDNSFYNVADCIPKNSLVQRGTVTHVIDGDTIDVQFEDGNIYSLRYIGIDAPESGRPFSIEASQANSDLVLNKDVILIKDQSEIDQYGRLLRYVIVDNVLINLELVREGMAKAENFPPDVACAETFATTEGEASEASVGMWVATRTPEATAAQVIILPVNKREEWVDIKNVGDRAVDLAGWNLVSERGHQGCPLSGVIKADETLRVWSMTAQEE